MSSEKLCTISGKPVDEHTREINPATGMQNDYIVLCEQERKKGFVRPYRESYKHVGIRPTYSIRELRNDEQYHKDFGYVAYEAYPESESPCTGRFWTKDQLNSGCGTVTTMGRALSETYARNPKFYGGTFCCGCQHHFPVEEFIWVDGGERVGS